MPRGTSGKKNLTPGSHRKSNLEKITNQNDSSKGEESNLQDKSGIPAEEFDSTSINNNPRGLNKSGLPSKSKRANMEDLLSEMRDSLKDTELTNSVNQVLPESSYQKLSQRPRLLQILDDWLATLTSTTGLTKKRPAKNKKNNKKKQNQAKTGPTRRVPARLVLVLIIFIVLLLVIYFAVKNSLQTIPRVVPTSTPVPTYSIPIPAEIELPGGWKLTVYPSESQFAEWKPAQPEWLKSTELCKLFAIPWSKQVSAVFKTFTPGEFISLVMSNNDTFKYKIDILSQISMDKMISLVDVNTPCLVVFVYQENMSTLQYLSASPSK